MYCDYISTVMELLSVKDCSVEDVLSRMEASVSREGIGSLKTRFDRLVPNGVGLRKHIHDDASGLTPIMLYVSYLFYKHWRIGGFIIAVDTRLYGLSMGLLTDMTDIVFPNPWCLGARVRSPIASLVLESHMRECFLKDMFVDMNAEPMKSQFSITILQPTWSQIVKYNLHSRLEFRLGVGSVLTVAPYDAPVDMGIICTGEVKGPIHFCDVTTNKILVEAGYLAAVCAIAIVMKQHGVPKDIRKLIAQLYLKKESRENVSAANYTQKK